MSFSLFNWQKNCKLNVETDVTSFHGLIFLNRELRHPLALAR